MDDFLDFEVLRSNLVMKTRTTFAEAAAMASIRAKERLLSSNQRQKAVSNISSPIKPFLIPNGSSIVNSDSTTSPQRSCNVSDLTEISDTESTCSHIGIELEGELAVRMLSLTLDRGLNVSADSFSSDSGNKFNKGAVEFMALVEKAIANEQAVKFEDLVVQMMDVSLNK